MNAMAKQQYLQVTYIRFAMRVFGKDRERHIKYQSETFDSYLNHSYYPI